MLCVAVVALESVPPLFVAVFEGVNGVVPVVIGLVVVADDEWVSDAVGLAVIVVTALDTVEVPCADGDGVREDDREAVIEGDMEHVRDGVIDCVNVTVLDRVTWKEDEIVEERLGSFPRNSVAVWTSDCVLDGVVSAVGERVRPLENEHVTERSRDDVSPVADWECAVDRVNVTVRVIVIETLRNGEDDGGGDTVPTGDAVGSSERVFVNSLLEVGEALRLNDVLPVAVIDFVSDSVLDGERVREVVPVNVGVRVCVCVTPLWVTDSNSVIVLVLALVADADCGEETDTDVEAIDEYDTVIVKVDELVGETLPAPAARVASQRNATIPVKSI
jgi:hypothetical protein